MLPARLPLASGGVDYSVGSIVGPQKTDAHNAGVCSYRNQVIAQVWHRSIMACRFIQGMPASEVAALSGLTVDEVNRSLEKSYAAMRMQFPSGQR